MGFSSLVSLQIFFSTLSLDIIVFADFVEKQQFALPATAREIPCRRSLRLAKMPL
jgi:hypothetical protein